MNYDVIIVGAGSAGCVLAARLSEDPARQVLLLEAGPDYPDPAALPPEIASSHLPAYTHDWDYYSEPGALGHAVHLVRARLVGGCSATNAALALRGAPGDYDEWAARGNPGWSFAEVLPFFCRLETDADFDTEWHGQDGPLPIRRTPAQDLSAVQAAFVGTCLAAGHRYVADHNAPGALGVGPAPLNALDGIRQSTALTYLATARRRRNLALRSGVLIDRILFEARRAIGVRLADTSETLRAGRVILAAGTYGSPAILLRSGLGPAGHLQALGLAVVLDLPGVGQNLIDHPLFGLSFASPSQPPARSVPFSQTVLTLRSALAGDTHDLQILPATILASDPGTGRAETTVHLFVSVLRPLSRGWLRLRSADPAARPIIDPGYLTHPQDVLRLLEAVGVARQLAQTPPLARWVERELYPGAQVSSTDSELEAAVRARLETYHHPVGTCRMGPATDTQAVVDPRGNVHGIENLSVIDASIMPVIPAANTNLSTIMLAERCVAYDR